MQEDGGEQGHQGGIEIEEQGDETGRGVVQRRKEAVRLADIAEAAHADQGEQVAAARPALPPEEHDHAHEEGGEGEAQRQHRHRLGTGGVGDLDEDRQGPE